jgi:serine phosphatase RsbU (regulator of sigma subunit)
MKFLSSSWPVEKKLIIVTLPIIATASILAAYIEHSRNEAGLHDKLTSQAKNLASQIMVDRQYYATTIVPRVAQLGGTLGSDYPLVHGRFPLPATFVREAAELSSQLHSGYTATLISPWPINKKQGVTDEFQRRGFAYLETHPDAQFIETNTIHGRPVLRVLVTDRATATACVSCHNAHPDSPRHDFKLGDVMGGLEITTPIDRYQSEIRKDLLLTFTGGGVMCVVVVGLLIISTRQFVTRPLSGLATRIASFASTQPQLSNIEMLAGNEINALTNEFEAMASTISSQQAELREANAHLEQRVIERTEQLRATMTEKERISSELRVASSIQQSILPRKFPPYPDRTDFDLYAQSIPAREMGGDFYDFFLIDEHRLGMVMADVSDKGVPAAIFMTVSRTLIKAEAMTGIEPGECLQRANRLLCQDNDTAMFVTVFYGVMDLLTGALVYANAGHNAPYLISLKGDVTALPGTGGMALGVTDECVFRTARVTVEPGSQLFLFTDGITEAMNVHQELFGETRLVSILQQAVRREPRELLAQVLKDVRRFAADAPQSDDLTAMVLCYHRKS